MIINNSKVADVTLAFGDGDILIASCQNVETGNHDTLCFFLQEPGVIGDTDYAGREDDREEATGAPHGEVQGKPAAVALRFATIASLRQLMFRVTRLYESASRDADESGRLIP